MREVLKFKGSLGQVVWLVDDADQNIIEVDWRECHKRVAETYDPILAAGVFFRAAEDLL